MLKFRCIIEQTSGIKIFEHFRIGFLYKQSCKRRLLCHISFFIYKLNKRKVIFSSYVRIVFTECRSNMNNACTVCQRNIFVTYNVKRFLVLLLRTICRALIKRLVFFSFQISSLICLKHLIRCFSFFCKSSKHRIKKRARHIINISVRSLYFRIIFFRIYTKRKVRRQRPGSCRPCKDIRIFFFYFESDDRRTFFYIFVSLCNFLCRKRRSAARAIRNDLKSFVKKPFIPDLL